MRLYKATENHQYKRNRGGCLDLFGEQNEGSLFSFLFFILSIFPLSSIIDTSLLSSSQEHQLTWDPICKISNNIVC